MSKTVVNISHLLPIFCSEETEKSVDSMYLNSVPYKYLNKLQTQVLSGRSLKIVTPDANTSVGGEVYKIWGSHEHGIISIISKTR